MPRTLLAAVLAAISWLGAEATRAAEFAIVIDASAQKWRLNCQLREPQDAPPTASWDRFVEKLFDFLDRDGNGHLDRTEQQAIPSTQLLTALWHGDLDQLPRTEPAAIAGTLTRAQFGQQLAALELPTIQEKLAAEQLGLAESRWLFARLAGKEGVCTEDTLKTAADRLLSDDANDDERWSLAELRAAALREAAVARSSAAEVPPVRLAVTALAQGPSTDGEKSLGTISLLWRSVQASGPAIRLSMPDSPGTHGWLEIDPRAPGQVAALRHEDPVLVLDVSAAQGDGAARFQDGKLELSDQLGVDDLNSDQVLDDKEIERSPRRELLKALRAAADRNADGRLALAELDRLLDLLEPAAARRLTITVAQSGSALFNRLDQNEDHVLSLRELKHGWSRLAAWDRARAAQLQWEDVPSQLQVVTSCGRPVPAKTASLPAAPVGPNWFIQMDRNQDGDVSRREFIGPRSTFLRLDADADQLLSPAEAQAAVPR